MLARSLSRLRPDITAGFLVFLVTLPLCMGIAIASGFPAVSGVLTSIIGGIVGGYLGGSPLSIKGAPAGLIVIVLAAVQELSIPGDPISGYRRALAVVVLAGAFQALAGYLRLGRMVEYFPVAVIHGMLSAIGVIVIAKQFHVLAGVKPSGKSIVELLGEIPHSLVHANPEVLLIGVLSLVTMLLCASPKAQNVVKIPAAVIVLAIGLIASKTFDMEHPHLYHFLGKEYQLGKEHLVSLPSNLMAGFAAPDWSLIAFPIFWKHVLLFALIGSIESCLTVKALDSMTRNRHKADANRDLCALGISNMICGAVGGLAMISEVARSKANVDAGAKTRAANIFHGVFLLVAIVLLPTVLERIPLAALAGLLVFIGMRLASWREFAQMYRRGPVQLTIFLVTLVLVVAVDLLIGVGVGFVLALTYWAIRCRSIKDLFVPVMQSSQDKEAVVFAMKSGAVFSSFAGVRRSLDEEIRTGKRVHLDLSSCRVVDREFLERAHALSNELGSEQFQFVTGENNHRAQKSL